MEGYYVEMGGVEHGDAPAPCWVVARVEKTVFRATAWQAMAVPLYMCMAWMTDGLSQDGY